MKTLLALALALVFTTLPGAYPLRPALAASTAQPKAAVKQDHSSAAEEDDEDFDEYDEEEEQTTPAAPIISDPLYKVNHAIYVFNDRLYFWALKPVARGYEFVVPQEIRVCIRNFFYNIRFPVRFVNCLLQGKGAKAAEEFSEFFMNTTVGFLGIADVAAAYPNFNPSPEDLGLTFAAWGAGNGAYLMLPFFGPSSVRDGFGRLGDTFLDPIWWAIDGIPRSLAVRAGETVNATSLRIGDYEALKQAALDPYVAIRNAYVQHRNELMQR